MDANDIVTPGIYTFKNASLPSNMEGIGSSNGILRVSVSSDGGSNTYILQEVISRTAIRVYASRFYAGGWTSWAKVELT